MRLSAFVARILKSFANSGKVRFTSATTGNAEPLEEAKGEVAYAAGLSNGLRKKASGYYGDTIPSPWEDRRPVVINERLTPTQLRRFWNESAPLFAVLTYEPYPMIKLWESSAINPIVASVNRGGTIGGKEGYQLCDLFRASRSADGNAPDHIHDLLARCAFIYSIRLRELNNHSMRTRGFNEARRDHIIHPIPLGPTSFARPLL